MTKPIPESKAIRTEAARLVKAAAKRTSVAAVARLLKLNRQTVWRYVSGGSVPQGLHARHIVDELS